MSGPPLTTRRKYLKYLGAAAIAAGAATLGAYEFGDYLGKQTTTSSATSTVAPTTLPASATSTSILNPVVRYALDKGIDSQVADKLAVLQDLNTNNATLVDYLSLVNGLESQRELAESLQLKVLYGDANVSGILSDGMVSDQETLALRYLSGLDAETQKGYILFGLDDHVSEYLAIISSLADQDFARLAVKNSLCMRTHHKLTDTEASYLTRLDESYSSYPELVEELTRLPDLLDVDERDLAAVDAVLFPVQESKRSTPYKTALQSMLAEGIRETRPYCSPLEALLWIAYDQDFRTNPFQPCSLDSLINKAWRRSSTSKNYTSSRWKSYDEARDRVNTPRLVNIFIFDYLTYDWSRMNIHPQGCRATYTIRRGVCRHGAYVATDFLTNGGYDAKNVMIMWGHNEGHVVSTVELEGGITIVVDFRGQQGQTQKLPNRPMNGPFKSYRDVELYLGQSFGKKISESYVDSNVQTMIRNGDFEYTT